MYILVCHCCDRLISFNDLKFVGYDHCLDWMQKEIRDHAHGEYHSWADLKGKIIFMKGHKKWMK